MTTINAFHLLEKLQDEFTEREVSMKQDFEKRLQEIKQKYIDELSISRNDLVLKYKKENGLCHAHCPFHTQHSTTEHHNFILSLSLSPTELQYEKMKQEKEEAQQDLERMYKRKLIDADVKIR